MATIQKYLNGVHNLVGGNDYYFTLTPPVVQGQPNSNILSRPLEEVYLVCDISNGNSCNIYLPSISTFNSLWNTKIYVSLINGNVTESASVFLYPFLGSIEPPIPSDTLNGVNQIVFSNTYDTYYLHVVAPTMWMSLYCPAPVRILG